MRTLLLCILTFLSMNVQAAHLDSCAPLFYTDATDLVNSAQNDDKLTILTNPVKDGQLRIKYLADEGVSFNLTIVNSLGEQVFSAKRNTSRQELSFDVSKLAAGLYFLRVNTDDSSVVKKLIIQ